MLENGEVLTVHQENPLIFWIKIKAPKIAAAVKAGQFVMVKIGDSFDPFLRRPVSVTEYDAAKGEISLMFKVVGIGTSLLSALKSGDNLSLMGPLGNGFNTKIEAMHVHLVAGGTGITPLLPLAAELLKKGKTVTVLIGTEAMKMIIHAEELTMIGCNVRVATMDGSFGCPDSVAVLVQREIEKNNIKYIYACGPNGLLKKIDAMAVEKSIPGQLSLESKMACGVGACKVCTCAKQNNETGARVSVCKDGPVFAIGEVEIDG